MRIIGAIIVFTVIILALLTGGGADIVFNLPAILFIILGTLGMIFLTNTIADLKAFAKFVTFKSNLNEEELLSVQKLSITGSRSAIVFGIIGALIGLIQMLQNLSDPSSIGIGMAINVLTILYGIIASELIFIPIAKIAGNKLKTETTKIPMTGLWLSLLVVFLFTGNFAILCISYY